MNQRQTDWIYVESDTFLREGVVEIERLDGDERSFPHDPELEEGFVELYQHPERGLCFWDHDADDGTDLNGHCPAYFLAGERIRYIISL